jgi:hypothetical protein
MWTKSGAGNPTFRQEDASGLGTDCPFAGAISVVKTVLVSTESQERRLCPRTSLSQAVRIRPFDPSLPPEYCTTLNASQDGLYFPTQAGHYVLGMSVYVTTDFQPDSPLHSTFVGVVVRIDKLESDKRGIAIHVLSPSSAAAN